MPRALEQILHLQISEKIFFEHFYRDTFFITWYCRVALFSLGYNSTKNEKRHSTTTLKRAQSRWNTVPSLMIYKLPLKNLKLNNSSLTRDIKQKTEISFLLRKFSRTIALKLKFRLSSLESRNVKFYAALNCLLYWNMSLHA